MMIVTGPLLSVLYTHLIHMANDPGAIRQIYLSVSRVLAIIIFPVIGMVAVSHQPAFRMLLSEKWSLSGDLFAIVAPACALQAVTALGGTVRMALGRTDVQLRVTVESGIIWIATLLIVVSFGLERVALAYNWAMLLYSPRAVMLVLPLIECSAWTYVRTIIAPVVVTMVCVATYWGCNEITVLGEWAQLCMAGGFAVAGIIAGVLLQCRDLIAEATIWNRLPGSRIVPLS